MEADLPKTDSLATIVERDIEAPMLVVRHRERWQNISVFGASVAFLAIKFGTLADPEILGLFLTAALSGHQSGASTVSVKKAKPLRDRAALAIRYLEGIGTAYRVGGGVILGSGAMVGLQSLDAAANQVTPTRIAAAGGIALGLAAIHRGREVSEVANAVSNAWNDAQEYGDREALIPPQPELEGVLGA